MLENRKNATECADSATAVEEDAPQYLGTLLEGFVKALTHEVVTQLCGDSEQHLAPLPSQLQELTATSEEIRRTQAALDHKMESLIAQNTLLEKASQEHARLSAEHYRQCIIDPMVRLLFPVIDVIDRTVRQGREEQGQASDLPWSVFEQLQVYLAQFLSFYDIKAVRHAPQSSFDPKVMKPVGFVACQDQEKDGYVARSLQAGFTRGTNGVLRFETVTLYRYKTSAQDLAAEGKGDRNGTSN